MELTEPPQPLAIDTDAGQPGRAHWLALTGWELDEDGRRLLGRHGLTVPRVSVVIETPGN